MSMNDYQAAVAIMNRIWGNELLNARGEPKREKVDVLRAALVDLDRLVTEQFDRPTWRVVHEERFGMMVDTLLTLCKWAP